MATYAIGDVQGCFDTFQRLLTRIGFDPTGDRLWLAGDLVNRGPASLDVLRWVREHEAACVTVLGNHDLHLLARAEGVARRKKLDTLEDVLSAEDRDELLDWLSRQPLLHVEDGHVLVHAGLHPKWSIDEAQRRAREAEAVLRGPDRRRFLEGVSRRRDVLPGSRRLRETVSVLTRIRMVDRDGRPTYEFSGHPDEAPRGQKPWFDARKKNGVTIVFGHWAALGRRVLPGFVSLDSACVWGGTLSAVRLDDGETFEEPRRDDAACA